MQPNSILYEYIPHLLNVFIMSNKGRVTASFNNGRIGFFGTEPQAGLYKVYHPQGYDLPVIKLPPGTVSITISFSTVSRLYNNDDVYIFWTKDEPYIVDSPHAKSISDMWYNARENNGALRVNTLSIPSGVDSFVGFFRIYPNISDSETPYSIANDVGFSITFNKQ